MTDQSTDEAMSDDAKTIEQEGEDMEFNNKSGLDFADISSEQFRVYTFAEGAVVRIDAPQKLHVSDSGGHRVFDAAGVSHYVPPGWVHLCWKAREGMPHFVK